MGGFRGLSQGGAWVMLAVIFGGAVLGGPWVCLAMALPQVAQRFDRVGGQAGGKTMVVESADQLPGQRLPDPLADLFWRQAAWALVEQEIERHQLKLDEQSLEDRVASRVSQRLAQMGDARAREQMYETVRTLNRAIFLTLTLWESDPAAGEREAQTTLRPLGVTAEHWDWIKRNYRRPDVEKAIRSGMDYGDQTIHDEERATLRKLARRSLLIESLQKQQPMDESAVSRRYIQLAALARQGRLTVWRRAVGMYASGQLRPREHRPASLPDQDSQGLALLGKHQFLPPGHGPHETWPDDVVVELATLAVALPDGQAGSWTVPALCVDLGLNLTVCQYRLGVEGALPPSADHRLSESEQRHLYAAHGLRLLGDWLQDRLRQEVTLDPASQWAQGRLASNPPSNVN